jgi:hypothetical protein
MCGRRTRGWRRRRRSGSWSGRSCAGRPPVSPSSQHWLGLRLQSGLVQQHSHHLPVGLLVSRVQPNEDRTVEDDGPRHGGPVDPDHEDDLVSVLPARHFDDLRCPWRVEACGHLVDKLLFLTQRRAKDLRGHAFLLFGHVHEQQATLGVGQRRYCFDRLVPGALVLDREPFPDLQTDEFLDHVEGDFWGRNLKQRMHPAGMAPATIRAHRVSAQALLRLPPYCWVLMLLASPAPAGAPAAPARRPCAQGVRRSPRMRGLNGWPTRTSPSRLLIAPAGEVNAATSIERFP